jgi:Fe-S cluster assembly iron-binding protein IscA
MEEEVMIEVTQKAAQMIKDFMGNQQGPGTVRILLQSC